MHTEYLQSLRYKLQKRIRRVKSTGFETYTLALKQLWRFLDREPLFTAIQKELTQKFPDADSTAQTIITEGLVQADRKGLIDVALTDEEFWAAVSLGVLRRFVDVKDYRQISRFIVPQSSVKINDSFAAFSDFYLTPFYEYVDERLDDPRFILGRLLRFKHVAEWFRRRELYTIWVQAPTRQGEKTIAMKLYEFLYGEGVSLQIEPWSASGEADMVGSQEGPERLVADAKVFNPDKGKNAKYILQGFRQIYQYTADYNEAIGYLVIFNTSNKQLRFLVSGDAAPLPKVVLNHKTIFFLVIDIYPYEETASKRPQQEVVEITEEEILGEVRANETVPKAVSAPIAPNA
jgi:hypothetical protein